MLARASRLAAAGLLVGCLLSLAPSLASAASFKLPPKPEDDPWPDVAPIRQALISDANRDLRIQRGYQLLVQDGGNWAGNEAAINFQFAADHGNPVGQAASCAVELANSRGEGQETWALRICRPAAEQGYATAQLMVGLLLQVAGLEYDPRKAAHWLRQAAGQGDTVAALALAEAYFKGTGVPADRKVAIDLLYQVTSTQHQSGIADYALYLAEDEPDRDAASRAVGRRALRAAAMAEFWPAQLRLSWLSRAGGDGVAKDVDAAHLHGNEALTNLIRMTVTPVAGP